MKIRAHHLLCIENFEGKGYSEEFVKNMENVIESISGAPHITPIAQPDAICQACPHHAKTECRITDENSEKHVSGMDQQVLDLLGFDPMQSMPYSDVQNILSEKLTWSDFTRICKSCSWFDICAPKVKARKL